MNLPNKLTVFRVILVPFFVLFLLVDAIPLNFLWSLIVFIVASLTDMLDGQIARKNNMVTTFGKFLDPIADKILVVSALVCFVELRLCSSVAVLIIIAREFIVTSVRLAAVDNGKVIAASSLGKLKTAVTMIAIIGIIALLALNCFVAIPSNIIVISSQVAIWVSTLLTIISGVEYLVKNKECINTTK